jgi:hypothetical protein
LGRKVTLCDRLGFARPMIEAVYVLIECAENGKWRTFDLFAIEGIAAASA